MEFAGENDWGVGDFGDLLMARNQTQRQQNHQLQQHVDAPIEGGHRVEVALCIPEDQKRYLPRRFALPTHLTPDTRPKMGEVVHLSPASVWGVALVIHDWPAPNRHRIEVWLERVVGHHHERPAGFALTQ